MFPVKKTKAKSSLESEFSVGVVSARSGVAFSAGGRRRYSIEVFKRLAAITNARRAGIPLSYRRRSSAGVTAGFISASVSAADIGFGTVGGSETARQGFSQPTPAP